MKSFLVSKNGKIYIAISYSDALGIPKKKWFSTGLDDTKKNRKQAEKIKEIKTEEFKKKLEFIQNDEANMLFSDFILNWLERLKPNLQISTYSTYLMQVEKIADYFKKKKISLIDLKPLDIANFYVYLQRNGKSVQLCEHYHVNIRKCLQSAVRSNLIPYNPTDRIDRPRSPKHVANFYTKDELDKLFDCLVGDNYAYIYKMTAYYGLRRSELVGLKWDCVDFKNNTITLKHTVIQTRIKGKSVIIAKDRMKNQSSFRTLPLLPEIKDLLLELRKKQTENKEMYGSEYTTKYEEYICVDDLGYRINPETVSSHFKVVLKNNNLKRIRFHELRHSCASLLLEKGVNMKEIQEWLGHSSYNTTANIYSHLDPKAKANVANVLNKTFEYEDLDVSDLEITDEIVELPKHATNHVRHKDNRKTIDVNENKKITEENTENSKKEKFIVVYENVEMEMLGATKRMSDLGKNHKFICKVKSEEEVNDLLVELSCTGKYDKEYLKEYGRKLRKKVHDLIEENEM